MRLALIKISDRHNTTSHPQCKASAALDLQDGHITARVEDRHCSVEFIRLLSEVDAVSPECIIRFILDILDNHSAHISK